MLRSPAERGSGETNPRSATRRKLDPDSLVKSGREGATCGCGSRWMVGHSENDPPDFSRKVLVASIGRARMPPRTDPERQIVLPAPPGAAVSPVGEPTTQPPKVAHSAPVAERPPLRLQRHASRPTNYRVAAQCARRPEATRAAYPQKFAELLRRKSATRRRGKSGYPM